MDFQTRWVAPLCLAGAKWPLWTDHYQLTLLFPSAHFPRRRTWSYLGPGVCHYYSNKSRPFIIKMPACVLVCSYISLFSPCRFCQKKNIHTLEPTYSSRLIWRFGSKLWRKKIKFDSWVAWASVGPNHSLACSDLCRNVAGGNWEMDGMWVGWRRTEEGEGQSPPKLSSCPPCVQC